MLNKHGQRSMLEFLHHFRTYIITPHFDRLHLNLERLNLSCWCETVLKYFDIRQEGYVFFGVFVCLYLQTNSKLLNASLGSFFWRGGGGGGGGGADQMKQWLNFWKDRDHTHEFQHFFQWVYGWNYNMVILAYLDRAPHSISAYYFLTDQWWSNKNSLSCLFVYELSFL